MATNRIADYKEYGLRLRAIREAIKRTADSISRETGISRSYISDFERGFRMPTSKYMRYLHDRHNVNLNYIFKGEGRKFRPAEEEKTPDFGNFQEQVDDLIRFMADMPAMLYAVLGFFAEYQLKNKDIIDRHRSEKAKTGGETA